MATANTDDKYDDLSKQIDALRADLSKITATVGDVARMEVEDAQGRVKGVAQEAKARGRRAAHRARVEAETDVEMAQDYVRERPLTAVAGAAALGLLFGFLTARR